MNKIQKIIQLILYNYDNKYKKYKNINKWNVKCSENRINNKKILENFKSFIGGMNKKTRKLTQKKRKKKILI